MPTNRTICTFHSNPKTSQCLGVWLTQNTIMGSFFNLFLTMLSMLKYYNFLLYLNSQIFNSENYSNLHKTNKKENFISKAY